MLEVRNEPWAEAAWYLEDRSVHTAWLHPKFLKCPFWHNIADSYSCTCLKHLKCMNTLHAAGSSSGLAAR